jgi:hypothetical protein
MLGGSDIDASGVRLDDGQMRGTGLGRIWLVFGHGGLQNEQA